MAWHQCATNLDLIRLGKDAFGSCPIESIDYAVKGTARVTRGDEVLMVGENESTFIPLGIRHRLENPGREPLEIVEVQSGDYLGEDDIVRFEDRYRRA